MNSGIFSFEVSDSIHLKYKNVTKIIVTKNLEYINLQDETGLIFSHSIKKSFTVKNITEYLKLFFNEANQSRSR